MLNIALAPFLRAPYSYMWSPAVEVPAQLSSSYSLRGMFLLQVFSFALQSNSVVRVGQQMRRLSLRHVDNFDDTRHVGRGVGTRAHGIGIIGLASFQLQPAIRQLPRPWLLSSVSARCLCLVSACEWGLLSTPVLLRSEGHRGGLAALCEEACWCDDPDSFLPKYLRPRWSAALHGKSKPDVCQGGL